MHYTDQSAFDARLEWGEAGLRALAPYASSMVIVDVLSFTTCVDTAVGRGVTVIPYRWRDDTAAELAREKGALLAVSRSKVNAEHPYSLSPESLSGLPAGSTIVLPSPNGATLSAIAGEFGVPLFAGCLRNASSVAAACREIGGAVAVIAAGERWGEHSDGSLRPAYEDLVGAGAILDALQPANPSPEARSAVAAFRDARDLLRDRLFTCSSGRELIENGYQRDVEIAALLDSSSAVPALIEGAFIDRA